MDWFKTLFGFGEGAYAETQANFGFDGPTLISRANERSWAVGDLEMTSLAELRRRFRDAGIRGGTPRVRIVQGDVGALHVAPEYAGALFQVASQFNALEMVGPNVTREEGVTGYEHDRTQGPACAMAAAPALVVRNYFAPAGGGVGQTSDRQLDGLADVGGALAAALNRDVRGIWEMRNGYALCTSEGLAAIDGHFAGLDEDGLDALRARFAIAVQRGVEVTAQGAPKNHHVSQAFCSALPVAYSRLPSSLWRRFAVLVLEAAYESTLLEAAIAAARGGSNVVLLTLLGGGALGTDMRWDFQGIRRAVDICSAADLDIRIVSYGRPDADLVAFVEGLGE